MPKRILLTHLDPVVETELRNTLRKLSAGWVLEEALDNSGSQVNWCNYDMVFCPPERAEVKTILAASTGLSHRLAVITASRIPEEREWVDMLEAGANDYVARPFEEKQIGRMLAACA